MRYEFFAPSREGNEKEEIGMKRGKAMKTGVEHWGVSGVLDTQRVPVITISHRDFAFSKSMKS